MTLRELKGEVGGRKRRGTLIFLNGKSPIHNGGPIAHRKFQHSSSIRKYLKIGITDLTFERVNPHGFTLSGGYWGFTLSDLRISLLQKSQIQNSGPNPHRKFQHTTSIEKNLKIRGTKM